MKRYRVSRSLLLILSPLSEACAKEKAPSAQAKGAAQQEILISRQQQVTE
jgi:hypothetical protein